jgi:two-component system, sensor histidine kinase and response regulator
MKKILVIDDEPWLREMVHVALQERGFAVVEAEHGAKGIDLARKEMPDLILCDVNMQNIDGYGTLSSLRDDSTTTSIPFILMTGLADHAGMRHGMELGADDYLPKPFTIEGLYAAVDARLRKAHALQQHAEKKLADLRENISLMLPHELRTPLNGILSFGELLATSASTFTPDAIAQMGRDIFDSARRLEHLVENFLIYAQIELLARDPKKLEPLRHKQTICPEELIRAQSLAQAAAAGREADLELDLTGVAVAASEEYLARIASELVQNAFKFSPPGTKVRVSLAPVRDSIVLTVRDTGRGFSTEQIARVGAYMQFDRRVHEQQGQGLGLAIAKRLVEIHGGSLSIHSEPGESTTVTAVLPAAKTHLAA